MSISRAAVAAAELYALDHLDTAAQMRVPETAAGLCEWVSGLVCQAASGFHAEPLLADLKLDLGRDASYPHTVALIDGTVVDATVSQLDPGVEGGVLVLPLEDYLRRFGGVLLQTWEYEPESEDGGWWAETA